jgi:hypothetical protein
MSIVRWIGRGVTAAAAIGGAILVAACGSAPGEDTSTTNSSIIVRCPTGYTPSCTDVDPSVAPGAKPTCTCVPLEQDSCTPDSRTLPSDSWLRQAGCTSGMNVWPTANGFPDEPLHRVTLWTCTNTAVLATLPAQPKIFNDLTQPCRPAPVVQFELVQIMMPGQAQLPSCRAPAYPTTVGECNLSTLASSCYPDPGVGQFVVVEWYDAPTFCQGLPGPCSGSSCRCTAVCGLTG